jgi:hypothetical protein
MRSSTLAALFVLLPTLAVAQSLGDQDNSGRFEGMPPGTDRYRDDSNSGSFSLPLEASGDDQVFEPRTIPTACVHSLKSARKVTPAERTKAACR